MAQNALSWTERLYAACYAGDLNEARLCITGGADVNSRDPNDMEGRTPLYLACENGRTDVVRLLLDRGAEVDGTTWPTDEAGQVPVRPLYVACEKGHVGAATLCLQRGASVNWATANGVTALWVACFNGHSQASRLCLVNGADIDTPSKIFSRGRPLEAAQRRGHLSLAAWLQRVRAAGGWTRFLSEPRYALVGLRALAAAGRARREASGDDGLLLDFLFPGDPPLAHKQARTSRLHLPGDLFPLVIRMYWSADEPPSA